MDPDSLPVRTQSRGIYLLPNLLTTGCLFSGFYAIVAAIDGNFERAGIAVCIARIADYGKLWYRFGWLAAFFYAVACALRLAKFNVRVGGDKRYFEGLPCPSAAAIVAAFLWGSSEWREPGLPGLILAFSITAAADALMVSRFSYSSFKSFDLTRPVRFIWLVGVALGFIVIAPDPPAVLLAIFGGYALWSPAVWLWRRARRSRRKERVE